MESASSPSIRLSSLTVPCGTNLSSMVQEAEKIYNRYISEGDDVTFVNARFLKPLDTELIDDLSHDHDRIVVIEEGIKRGGYGSAVEEYVEEHGLPVKVMTCA